MSQVIIPKGIIRPHSNWWWSIFSEIPMTPPITNHLLSYSQTGPQLGQSHFEVAFEFESWILSKSNHKTKMLGSVRRINFTIKAKFCYMFTSLKQCFYILLSSFLMQLVVDLFDFSIECSKFISVFVQFWFGQGRKFLESLSLGQKGCCQEMFIFSFSHIVTYSS